MVVVTMKTYRFCAVDLVRVIGALRSPVLTIYDNASRMSRGSGHGSWADVFVVRRCGNKPLSHCMRFSRLSHENLTGRRIFAFSPPRRGMKEPPNSILFDEFTIESRVETIRVFYLSMPACVLSSPHSQPMPQFSIDNHLHRSCLNLLVSFRFVLDSFPP